MSKYPPPSPPMIPARWKGGSQTPRAIVMHGTVTPDRPGSARGVAHFFATEDNKTSAHYVVDPGEVIQCVGDHTVAYHCGYNTGSIGVELCDEEQGPASRWEDANSKAIIARAATLVAQLCLAYDIDPHRPSIADLKAHGPHGIYGHNDSRLAFGNTTHSDPIGFPWARFLTMVRAEMDRLKVAGGEKPTPTLPDPSTPQWSNPATKRDKVTAAAMAALVVFVAAVGGWLHSRHDSAGVTPAKPEHVSVFAWNEKSFPPMPARAYRQDFRRVLPLASRAVFLHSEMSGREVGIFKAAAAKVGAETYGVRKVGDTAISTRGLERGRTTRIEFADKPAGPASPARTGTFMAQDFAAGPVVFISAHPPNGCSDKNRGKPWYAARCQALRQSITLLHKVVHYLVRHGYAVVIGGDMNQRKVIVWDKGQSTATGPGLVQLAAIDSADVDLTLTRAKPVPASLHTDHRVIRSELTVAGR